MISINFAGDLCIENNVEKMLSQGNNIISSSFKFWYESDFRIVNLESPITDSEQKILKTGRCIKASNSITNGLKKLEVTHFSLANNHIMDYGVKGLEDTINALKKIESNYFGISIKNENDNIAYLEKNGVKVAIASFSNNENSISSNFNGTGAVGMNSVKIYNSIQNLLKKNYQIVVILHTGLSGNPLPSPRQKEFCRHLIDIGCKMVLCQHSHIVGSFENYNNGFISYGQGSFAFDLKRENTFWNEGYVVSAQFSQDTFETKIVGLKQFNNENCIRQLDELEKNEFEKKMNEINTCLIDEQLYAEKWSAYVLKKEKYYLREMFFSKNKIVKKIFPNVDFSFLLTNRFKMKLLNFFRNEEHSEIIQEILKNKLK